MKKKKLIIIFLSIIVILVAVVISINLLNDNNRLTIDEKTWISENKNNVISINVNNTLNLFGKEGKGIYFDFLNDVADNYNIQINPVTYDKKDEITTTSLGYSLDSNSLNNFYSDEFVLVSKKMEKINNIKDISNLKIMTLKEYKEHIQKYINNKNEYIEEETKDELLKKFKENNEIQYLIIPKIMYLDEILSNNYYIVYHISDCKMYHGVSKDNSAMSNIMYKYFNEWKNDNFEKFYNEHELEILVNNLKITSADLDNLKATNYVYGFVNNEPYEIISNNTYGGITATYLKKISDILGIKIEFNKYATTERLQTAINEGKVNIYFDYHNLNGFDSINTNIYRRIAVLAKKDNNIVVNSLASLNDKKVFAEENTKISDYLVNKSLKLETYKTDKELKKAVKNNNIIIIDYNKYEEYKNSILSDYSIRYIENTNENYNLKINGSAILIKIANKLFEIYDNNELYYTGLNNYYITKRNGTLLGTLAKYILILLIIFIVISYIVYKKGKKIKVAKRIKKDDKMKFIDQLTSLKNRNYLTENIKSWNENTIYPQAVIVLDLNRLQEINDTLGYEKGDEQIQAAANILIKTQLDNTDIIRTDGNEFLIYLIGYEVRQITSYIHKLNREFKKLPFDYGVAVGYSMILDDVKSIEDATNEAVEQVKMQKEELKDE